MQLLRHPHNAAAISVEDPAGEASSVSWMPRQWDSLFSCGHRRRPLTCACSLYKMRAQILWAEAIFIPYSFIRCSSLGSRDERTQPVRLSFGPNFRKSSGYSEHKLFQVYCGTLRPNPLILKMLGFIVRTPTLP